MRKSRGVTLVEILIALAILAIAFVGLLASILHSSQANAVNSDTNRATRAAEQALEAMIGSVNDPADIFATYNRSNADIQPFNPYAGGIIGTFDVLADGQIIFGGNPGTRALMFQRVATAVPIGNIDFPESPAGVLNETATTALSDGTPLRLGTGPNENLARDLNQNGTNTQTDVTATHRILPCRIKMLFIGADGTRRTVEFRKIIWIEPPPPPSPPPSPPPPPPPGP